MFEKAIISSHYRYQNIHIEGMKVGWYKVIECTMPGSRVTLPLMLLRSGMNSLMMCTVQHQLPPPERSLNLPVCIL